MIGAEMAKGFLARAFQRLTSRTALLRRHFRVLLALLIAPVSLLALGDVIFLKNGRKIVSGVTREDSKQVYYERGGGEIAIPKSLVDRIEKSDDAAAPETPNGQKSARELPLPAPPPAESLPGADLPVIKSGIVDESYLRGLDNEFIRSSSPENRLRLKRGYQEAAIFHTRSGNAEAAIQDYRHALKFLPDDLPLTLALGYLLVTQNHYLEAIDLLLPASDHFPRSPDLHMLLGSAFYGQENLDQAISEWNKALALQDNSRLREAVAKAERERSIAGSFQELRSQHFLLRYEGEAEKLSGAVLNTLEAVFVELERDLDFYPSETIVVLLYPNEAFRDVTRSPDWVGALNDGKIRVPVSGLAKMTPELARVLKHELAHSFVRQITQGRCPVWFNEGLAQLEEGATTAVLGSQLARAFAGGRLPQYSALETSFIDLPQDQVGLAYAKSLAALEYLRDTQGLGEIDRLLKGISASSSFARLLQNGLRLSYSDFEQEVGAYVEKRYGGT